LIINGWRIYFIKRLFGKQRRDLQAEVRKLKKTLPPEEYRTHPTVKLYTAIMVAIKEKIPLDPFASHFALTGALAYTYLPQKPSIDIYPKGLPALPPAIF
jgi:toxin YhaV